MKLRSFEYVCIHYSSHPLKGGEKIMMKKLIAGVGAAALVVAVTSPALACSSMACLLWGADVNVAVVENTAVSTANTGDNSQRSRSRAGGVGFANHAESNNRMVTGNANSASYAEVDANNQGCGGCNGGFGLDANVALVRNRSESTADTGSNTQRAKSKTKGFAVANHAESNNGLVTGHATSRADGWVIVNSTVSPM